MTGEGNRMCQAIFWGDIEISTIGELKEWLPMCEVILDCNYKTAKDDACLCAVDIEKTLSNIGIPFDVNMNDYFVESYVALEFYKKALNNILLSNKDAQ